VAQGNERTGNVLIDLSIVNALASQLFDRRLVKMGVKPAQAGVLSLVGTHGPVTQKQLEYESGLPPTTLRERLQSLETGDFVRRVPNPSDGRSHFVELTAAGEALLEQVNAAVQHVEAEISRALGSPIDDYRAPLERLRRAEQSLLDDEPFPEEGPGTAVTFP
jgi:DNA-binding MarR family transcriptional regulator